MRQNSRIGIYYLSGSCILILVGFLLRPLGWVLLWPALSVGLVAVGYFGVGPKVYGKTDGQHQVLVRLLHFFTIRGQEASRRAYAKQCNPWDEVAPKLLIGRQLIEVESHDLVRCGVHAVLDLTAEFSEPESLRRLNYKSIPLLDLTAPSKEQIIDAVRFIDEHIKTGGVYVHCKIGYSRTAAITGCYLIHTGQACTANDAMELLRKVRPSIIIRPEARHAIESYAA